MQHDTTSYSMIQHHLAWYSIMRSLYSTDPKWPLSIRIRPWSHPRRSYHGLWCYMMLYHAMWYYMTLYDVIWCYIMLYDAISCYIMLYYAVWCYIMLCDVKWRYMMLVNNNTFFTIAGINFEFGDFNWTFVTMVLFKSRPFFWGKAYRSFTPFTCLPCHIKILALSRYSYLYWWQCVNIAFEITWIFINRS